MNIIPLLILTLVIWIAFIIWFFYNREVPDKKERHFTTRALIPCSILSVWLLAAWYKLPDGETQEIHKVFSIGEKFPIQVIVVRPNEVNTFPSDNDNKNKHDQEKIININRYFGCYLPTEATVVRKYSHAIWSLGVSYHGTRSDVLILDLPNNTRTTSNFNDHHR